MADHHSPFHDHCVKSSFSPFELPVLSSLTSNLPAKCKTLTARMKEYMKVQSAEGKALQTSVGGLSDVVLFHNKQPVS